MLHINKILIGKYEAFTYYIGDRSKVLSLMQLVNVTAVLLRKELLCLISISRNNKIVICR